MIEVCPIVPSHICVWNICVGDHHVIPWLSNMALEPMREILEGFISDIEDLLARN